MSINVEPDAIDNTYRSNPAGPSGPGTNIQVLGNAPKLTQTPLLFKTDYNYGTNAGIPGVQVPTDTANNAQKIEKTSKSQTNPQNLVPTNPTVASAPLGQEILQATKTVDPGNVVGVIKKALDAMIMLKMMNSVSSSGGAASILQGALGGALQLVAGTIGMQQTLNGLNAISPTLTSTLSSSTLNAVNEAISAMISNTGTGALSADSVAAANALAVAITSAVSSNSSSTIANTAATIGGPLLGVSANTLAAQIIDTAIGQTIQQVTTISGATVITAITILTNDIQTELANIPSLQGNENVTIANNLVATIASDILSLGISALPAIIASTQASITNQGLQTILGTTLTNIISSISTLLPNIAPVLTQTLPVHVPKTVLNPMIMNSAIQQATKVMALGQLALNISKMFGNSLSQQAQNTAAAMNNNVATQSIGTTLTAVIAGASITSTRVA